MKIGNIIDWDDDRCAHTKVGTDYNGGADSDVGAKVKAVMVKELNNIMCMKLVLGMSKVLINL